jgi:hypothetical protein
MERTGPPRPGDWLHDHPEVTSTDPRERLERTLAFCTLHRFSEEAAFLERARAAILG